MKECCASFVWFYVDDYGEELCTVNPPDYKGDTLKLHTIQSAKTTKPLTRPHQS